MVKSYTLAGAAALACLLLAICAVISTVYILHDISDFYTEAQGELVEFKDIANNVWDEMVFELTPEEMREAEDNDREKRSYEGEEPYEAETSTTTTTTTTTTAATTTGAVGDESGYDFGHDNGPPSSRPRKPIPPTMPRTIQGFRAPPPAATSTYRPPHGHNYDNYGREPASSRRPNPPQQPYQQASTVPPYSTPNNRTIYNPPQPPKTVVYPSNPRVPYNPPSKYSPPPPYPGNSRVPYNPNYTHSPNTPPPRQPAGGYDSDGQTPPTWPKVYNTRRPNGPGYPEDQLPTRRPNVPEYPEEQVPSRRPNGPAYPEDQAPTRRPNGQEYPEDEVPTATQVPGQQRVPPTQTRNPSYPDRTNPRQPTRPVPPTSDGEIETSTPYNPDEIPPGRTGYRPGFGPQKPRPGTRQRINPCDQCSAQPNKCPAGPPGPRGRPGPPGFPGQDGPRGLRGLNGGYSGVHPSSYDPVIGCVQCPVGPPGERGTDGPPGPPGEDGIDGEQGSNGQDGQPGSPGAPGYHGMNGTPGASGKPGVPGRNGQSCRAIPGPPGQPGVMGVPGRDGDPGTDGEHGQDGSPGIQGPPGKDGRPGTDGQPGVSAPGAPGTDGGYCPCPKRSSKFDFTDPGYTDEGKRSQDQRPREYSSDREEETRQRQPARTDNYEDRSGYDHERKPVYEPSAEVAPPRRDRYKDEERVREPPPSRQPPPQRQSPRPEQRYPEEQYERRPQENRGDYERGKPREYTNDVPRTRQGGEHSSGYGADERREQSSYMDRRPVEQPRYETEEASRNRPLKKVEINRQPERGYDHRQPSYENKGSRREETRYGTESGPVYEEERKETHPPGFGRPKSEEERRDYRTYPEDSMPPVKQTDRYSGDKRKKNQPEYEDISKPEEDKDKGMEKHHRKTNKFQEKQWEEHRKSQELRNSREHGGEVPSDNSSPMQEVKPEERERRSSGEEKVHDNYQSSEKRGFVNENPLPSEQIPYRRRTRFYRNHYYEKFLA